MRNNDLRVTLRLDAVILSLGQLIEQLHDGAINNARSSYMKPGKIISGGQTGADRAALDYAIKRGVPSGGWCPKGRLAEDGPIPDRYSLNEMSSPEYPPRTKKNVQASDATAVFDASGKTPSRGTKLTVRFCKAAGKPHIVLTKFPDVAADAAELRNFLQMIKPEKLNVAGNRESGTPGIYTHVLDVLTKAFE